ncbi:glycoside hydrolase family 74 protein, partial [Colletotrichum sojae]
VYAFGTGSAGRKLYGSSDLGASWVDLQGSQSFGAIDSAKLAGSGNEENLVYVGTNGRGVFYASGAIAGGGSGGGSTSAAVSTSTARVTSSVLSSVRTTTLATSTVRVTSSVRTSTSSAPAATATNLAKQYEQCGGQNWSGPTACVAPFTCVKANDFYSQCL